ncbi:hexokinase-1-like [Asparagus officinalis]|nr:hexokinase-1-like [Asparagus officinalis]
MPVSKMWDVADAMVAEMRAGLFSNESGVSSLRMLVSPIDSFPTGNEEGTFYGVEMGRTKVCVFRAQLAGKELGVAKKELMEVPVPINLMVGTSEELYHYLAAQLVKFIASSGSTSVLGKPKEVGVAFSFPVIHSATEGIHVEWNKGFSIKESAGRDALTMLNEAMVKHGVDMHIASLVNNTVGTLVGGRYCSHETVAAIILGNGTNAAYLEPLESVPKWHGSRPPHGQLVINMEWGDFLSSHLPVTEFDSQLDNESPRPGEQIFEKLISGMYLGDIVRRVLLKLAEETALFGDSVPLKLRIPFALRTPDVASMHQDTSSNLRVVAEKLDKALGIHDTTRTMRKLVVEVCDAVTKRAARLAGAGIVGILKKLGRDGTDKKAVVVVEGGLYEHYRLFRTYLHSSIKEMLQGKFSDNVVIEHWPDVCGVGSALLSVPSSHV